MPLFRRMRRVGITPNHITIVSFIFCVISAYAFPSHTVIFPLFLVLSYICDGLDGLYARSLHLLTRTGHLLDKSLDTLGGCLFYIQAIRILHLPLAPWAFALYGVHFVLMFALRVDREVGASCDFRIFSMFGLHQIGLIWDVCKFTIFAPLRTVILLRARRRIK